MQKKKEDINKKERQDKAEPHQIGDKSFKAIMKVKNSALEYLEVFFPKL